VAPPDAAEVEAVEGLDAAAARLRRPMPALRARQPPRRITPLPVDASAVVDVAEAAVAGAAPADCSLANTACGSR
jgi:hypothetical protein